MHQSVKQLSESEKEQILQASYEPECVITDLAKQHGIPPKVIYDWRGKKKAESVVGTSEKAPTDFIELSVTAPVKKAVSLKRGVLEFDNLSISIDGNIKSSSLIKMINVLEESC